jgi:ribose transport system substrate-binding protein
MFFRPASRRHHEGESTMKKFLSCALVLTALYMAGCGGQTAPETPGEGAAATPEAPGKPVIALIMKSLANEFFKTMEDGAKAHQTANAANYELVAEGIKDEADVNRQVQLVEQMVARGVDAIVLAPADSKALVAACKRAQDAGIVVVNIDNKLDAEVLKDKAMTVPFVGPDNRAGAQKVGEHLAGTLQAGDKVAIVEGMPSAFNAIQRKLGFEDAMNAAGMVIATSQTADWEMAKANQVVSAMVTEHPDLKAVLCANDSMALGAVSALRSAGKLGDIKVVGFDNISAAQDLLKEGALLATADQHGDKLAVFGIEYALEMINTKAAPADRETPVDLVTAAP